MSPGEVRIYWHGDLPPLEAEAMGEHVLEATSHRVREGWRIAPSSGASVTKT